MSIPGVPRGIRRGVLNAFIAQLKGHPLLANKRVIKTWRAWDGSSPIAEPSIDEMPLLQIRMIGGPVTRLASTRTPGRPMTYANRVELTVLLDLFTAGTDQGDLADVAELVHAALAPSDPAERAALELRFREAGIADWQLTRDLLPSSAESFAESCVMGSGVYELSVFLQS